MKVKLDDVLNAIFFAGMETEFYYDTKTEKVIMYMQNMINGDENSPLLQELFQESERFILLPTCYDINEYDIIKDFICSLPNQNTQNRLFSAISGKGAFRRFKDIILYLGIENSWYKFRDAKYKKIAHEWCEKNSIKIIEE